MTEALRILLFAISSYLESRPPASCAIAANCLPPLRRIPNLLFEDLPVDERLPGNRSSKSLLRRRKSRSSC